MTEGPIYHVCTSDEWRKALRDAAHRGSSQDRADGFIHFSDASQIAQSVRKHRAGQDGLVILEVDPTGLAGLKWEPSRGGALFPHLHGDLPVSAVSRVADLILRPDGTHELPWGLGS